MSSLTDQHGVTNRYSCTAETAGVKALTTAVQLSAVMRERYKKHTGRDVKAMSGKAKDSLISEYADLTRAPGKDMSGYYSRILDIIGEIRFRELASQARSDGREGTKPGYFSWLLKHEVGPIKKTAGGARA